MKNFSYITENALGLHDEGHPFNHLNAELNPICHLLSLLGADHIFHISGLRVNNTYLLPGINDTHAQNTG